MFIPRANGVWGQKLPWFFGSYFKHCVVMARKDTRYGVNRKQKTASPSGPPSLTGQSSQPCPKHICLSVCQLFSTSPTQCHLLSLWEKSKKKWRQKKKKQRQTTLIQTNNFYTHTTYNDNNVMMLNVLSCLANVVIFIGLSSQINFIVDRFSYYIVLFVVCHLVFFRWFRNNIE